MDFEIAFAHCPSSLEVSRPLRSGVLDTRIDNCSNFSLDSPTEDSAFARYMFMGRGSIIEPEGRSFFFLAFKSSDTEKEGECFHLP